MEKKFFDTTRAAAAFGADNVWENVSGTAGFINAIQQGDGESNRDGRKIVITSVHARFQLASNTVTRIIGVIDKQTNGAATTIASILDTASSTDDVLAFRNLQTTTRYTIFYDETIDETYNSGGNRIHHCNKKMDLPVQYDASTGAITDVVDRSIQFWAITGTATNSTFAAEYRVRFVG